MSSTPPNPSPGGAGKGGGSSASSEDYEIIPKDEANAKDKEEKPGNRLSIDLIRAL